MECNGVSFNYRGLRRGGQELADLLTEITLQYETGAPNSLDHSYTTFDLGSLLAMLDTRARKSLAAEEAAVADDAVVEPEAVLSEDYVLAEAAMNEADAMYARMIKMQPGNAGWPGTIRVQAAIMRVAQAAMADVEKRKEAACKTLAETTDCLNNALRENRELRMRLNMVRSDKAYAKKEADDLRAERDTIRSAFEAMSDNAFVARQERDRAEQKLKATEEKFAARDKMLDFTLPLVTKLHLSVGMASPHWTALEKQLAEYILNHVKGLKTS